MAVSLQAVGGVGGAIISVGAGAARKYFKKTQQLTCRRGWARRSRPSRVPPCESKRGFNFCGRPGGHARQLCPGSTLTTCSARWPPRTVPFSGGRYGSVEVTSEQQCCPGPCGTRSPGRPHAEGCLVHRAVSLASCQLIAPWFSAWCWCAIDRELSDRTWFVIWGDGVAARALNDL